jgi:hypothetical protein
MHRGLDYGQGRMSPSGVKILNFEVPKIRNLSGGTSLGPLSKDSKKGASEIGVLPPIPRQAAR